MRAARNDTKRILGKRVFTVIPYQECVLFTKTSAQKRVRRFDMGGAAPQVDGSEMIQDCHVLNCSAVSNAASCDWNLAVMGNSPGFFRR